MAETGGPTTQSGILYQNTWSALYLGRLIDPRPRGVTDTVIAVRVEAPEAVDDIVVTHADGSRSYIQAKESISSAGPIWIGLWKAFFAQFQGAKTGFDHLVLAVGNWTNDIGTLRETCQRATGKATAEEWFSCLSQSQQGMAMKIIDALPTKDRKDAFCIAASTEIWVQTLEQLQQESAPGFIPPSSVGTLTLFSLLRDMVGGQARIRGTFQQADLLDRLQREHSVIVRDTPEWGIDRYRQAVKKLYGTLAVPGTAVSGPIEDMFLWLPLRDRAGEAQHRDFEEEDLKWRHHLARPQVDLRSFPRTETRRAIIDASAGFGKTTLLHALTQRLASDPIFVPVIVPLNALAETTLPIHDYLNRFVNDSFEVALDWTRLCEGGRAVVFLDGLDELADAHRCLIAGAIARFGARFPRVAWLLTVRDGSALPQPLDAQRLDIDRLDNEQVLLLAKAYKVGGACISPERLREDLVRHPDLAHLLRIPLFLALVLATVKVEEDLPRNRSELLETYLSLLCAPERHKQTYSHEYLDDLREAAEYLASHGLEAGGVGIAEQQAKTLLRNSNFTGQAGIYIERLLRIGLLRRQGPRLQFTYPIIQEYLAACWMVREMPEQVGERFRYVAKRPWAQAIQFSLEMHPEAEKIIRAQLNLPDDAFHTILRLIGRCVVNGARLSPKLKEEIGDLLAEAWASESYNISRNIGLLIADGFVSPLPQKAEVFLGSGQWLQLGGAEIVTAKNDVTLTTKVLDGFLSRNLERHCWLHGWQDQVNQIAEVALSMYIQRAKLKCTTICEAASIAKLISHLPQEGLADAGRIISADETLPPLIRLAGFQLSAKPIEPAAMKLLIPLLCTSEGELDYWVELMAEDFFWEVKGARKEFINLAGTQSTQDRIIFDLVHKLFKSDSNPLERQEILRAATTVASGDRQLKLKLMLAVAGDQQAAIEIVDMLADLPDEIVQVWCFSANNFSGVNSTKALTNLKRRIPLGNKPITMLSNLITGITYKMVPSYQCSGTLDYPQKHENYQQFIEWIGEVVQIKSLSLDQRCLAARLKKELGHNLVSNEILALLDESWTAYLACSEKDIPYALSSQVETSIDIMDAGMYSQCNSLLREIACSTAPNANSKALRALAQIGGIIELEWMIEKYRALTGSLKTSFFETAERISARLGKRIIRDSNNLRVEDW
jgi:hypothetical protein